MTCVPKEPTLKKKKDLIPIQTLPLLLNAMEDEDNHLVVDRAMGTLSTQRGVDLLQQTSLKINLVAALTLHQAAFLWTSPILMATMGVISSGEDKKIKGAVILLIKISPSKILHHSVKFLGGGYWTQPKKCW
uniref:Uncharacterized protein n=1 Tax=Davidia involucrata TaxID=16924 RepID=A0A5B7C022_DAVIN